MELIAKTFLIHSMKNPSSKLDQHNYYWSIKSGSAYKIPIVSGKCWILNFFCGTIPLFFNVGYGLEPPIYCIHKQLYLLFLKQISSPINLEGDSNRPALMLICDVAYFLMTWLVMSKHHSYVHLGCRVVYVDDVMAWLEMYFNLQQEH